MDMLNQVGVQALSGAGSGMILFLVASGLTLIFGTLRIANFAHGSFYMLAAYIAWTVTRQFSDATWGFWVALALAPLALALLGAGMEFFLLRRVAGRAHQYQLILTYAVTLIVADAVKMLWGRDSLTIPRPRWFEGGVEFLDAIIPTYYFLPVGAGIAVAVGLHVLLIRTRFGKTVRAAVADPDMVSALGVDVPRLNTAVFALGSWLAGLGGVLAAPVGSISLGMDAGIIIESFAVVIIGGVGSVTGALLGALLTGVAKSVGILFAPKLAIVFVFLALCVVLLVRPQGLMGRAP